jgi:hypothetical protein
MYGGAMMCIQGFGGLSELKGHMLELEADERIY